MNIFISELNTTIGMGLLRTSFSRALVAVFIGFAFASTCFAEENYGHDLFPETLAENTTISSQTLVFDNHSWSNEGAVSFVKEGNSVKSDSDEGESASVIRQLAVLNPTSRPRRARATRKPTTRPRNPRRKPTRKPANRPRRSKKPTSAPTSCIKDGDPCIQYVTCDSCCNGGANGFDDVLMRTVCGDFAPIADIKSVCVNNPVPNGTIPSPNYKGPGYLIKNDTPWPLEISLWQVGPVHWKLVQPGDYFFKQTGPIWFTVRADVKFENKSDITIWDALFPTADIVASVIIVVVSFGATNPALAVAFVAINVGQVVSYAALAVFAHAGLNTGFGLFVAGAFVNPKTAGYLVVSDNNVVWALEELNEEYLNETLTKDVMSLSRPNIYAGDAFFPQKPLEMRVYGGPKVENVLSTDNNCYPVLTGTPLNLSIPCLPDAYSCIVGKTCSSCCNASSTWYSKLERPFCGKEPCWLDGSLCDPAKTCNLCCNKAYNFFGSQCGGTCWADGTICDPGSNCNLCCNGPSYWHTKLTNACGTEPCLVDGTLCDKNSSCKSCCNKAYNALGYQCGGSCWGDGSLCEEGANCDLCCNGSSFWHGKQASACGKEVCWAPRTACFEGSTCNACCNGASWQLACLFTCCNP